VHHKKGSRFFTPSLVVSRRDFRVCSFLAVLPLISLVLLPSSILAAEPQSRSFEELHADLSRIEAENLVFDLIEKGDQAVAAGELEEAERIFSEVRAFPVEEGGRSFEAEGLYGLGTVFESRGHHVTAMEYYLQALAAAETAGLPYIVSAVHNSMGNIHQSNGDIEGALESYQLALGAIPAAEDPVGTAQVLGNIADLYRQKDEFSAAHHYLDQAEQVLRSHQYGEDDAAWGFLHGNRGQTLLAEKRFREAIQRLERSVKISRDSQDIQSLAADLVHLGEAYAAVGAVTRGISLIEQGIDLASKINVLPTEEEGLRALSRLYGESGNCDLALKQHLQAESIRERVINQQTAVRAADLRELYRTNRKEKEIELLRARSALAELQVKQARSSRNQMVAASLAGLLALIFVYFQYRQKSSANRLIHAKNRELENAYARMEELAQTDPLTGLLNRRAMISRIEVEISRAQKEDGAFCLALIDIDHFKHINDRYGHEAGDRALVMVAETAGRLLRTSDCCARWGGEEFLVLLPQTDLDGGRSLSERVREEVAATRIECEGARFGVTLTIGLSPFEPGANLNSCIRMADRALYQGKHSGRNRVVAA